MAEDWLARVVAEFGGEDEAEKSGRLPAAGRLLFRIQE